MTVEMGCLRLTRAASGTQIKLKGSVDQHASVSRYTFSKAIS